jgi:hypothetical protein
VRLFAVDLAMANAGGMMAKRRKKGERVAWGMIDKWGILDTYETKKEALENRDAGGAGWEGRRTLCEVRLLENEREDPVEVAE